MDVDCIEVEAQDLGSSEITIMIRYKFHILMYLKVNICPLPMASLHSAG